MSHELQILPSQTSGSSVPLPLPRVAINIRPGTMDDLPFIDGLQKKHTKQVGFMPTKQFEGKIKAGHVIVAWAPRPRLDEHVGEAPTPQEEERVGYLIGNDQYFKRDDVGIIYQMNVVPGKQRGFVGASLLKAQFERSAYGCKLYCCWCAQDIEANYFWESLGFVPLAFRAGSRGKGRVHIFWQRRIREGDTGQGGTPYWFPAQTNSGSIREDRIVLPIPPGVHWRDVMPIVLPEAERTECLGLRTELEEKKQRALPGAKRTQSSVLSPQHSLLPPTHQRVQFGKPSAKPLPAPDVPVAKKEKPKKQKASPERSRRVKNDPKLVAAARELRDRWLEKVNGEGFALEAQGKYDISRQIPTETATKDVKLLAA